MKTTIDSTIRNIAGTAIPKPENDQDTDAIVPARYLKEITFANMGEYAYFDERFKDGERVPNHPFNDHNYRGARILIAGANYGCGSSREHAPQALQRFGISAIIAESYAGIFEGNCASIGIVGVTTSSENIARLTNYVGNHPQAQIGIDLETKTIMFDDYVIGLSMPEGTRQAFLNGTWDAMSVLQKNQNGIRQTERRIDYLKFPINADSL